jgi:predicted RNase H-like nuclease
VSADIRAIGIDLAWGQRGRTGLAAVTRDGALIAMDSVRSDDEIGAWMQQHAAGACLVAVDAPVVVRNASGMRRCERLVSRRYGARGASCYPSNRANPSFTDGGRAWRLADELGLDTALDSVSPRRVIEVYPHAAIVELFDLSTVLRYKRGRRRTVEARQGELLRLMTLIESLADADPAMSVAGHRAWIDARSTIEAATRPLHLAVEDAVDAVVCAYVSLVGLVDSDRLETFGNDAEGAIIVPRRASG